MSGSDTDRLYRDFWEAFSDRVEKRDDTSLYFPPNFDLTQHFLPQKRNLPPQINYSIVSNTNRGLLEVKLHIRGDRNRRDELFSYLKKHRDTIETRLGKELTWSRNDAYDKISLQRAGNVNNRDQWNEYLDWFITYGEAFDRVFDDYLRDFEG